MSRISRVGRRTYRRVAEGPVLPQWVKVLPVALGAVGFFLVSSNLFDRNEVTLDNRATTSSDIERIAEFISTEDARIAYQIVTTGTVPPELQSTAPDDTSTTGSSESTAPSLPTEQDPINPGVGQLVDVVTVPLLDRAGVAVPVEEPALAMARAATVALFTGDFALVPLAPGVVPPNLPRRWEDPYVGEPTVHAAGDSTVAIAFVVDPDRSGPALPREIITAVENVGPAAWVWLGA